MIDETRLRQIFPRGSESFIKANASVSHPLPQRNAPPALELVPQGKTKGRQRIGVRVCSYRVRPVDPDNLAGGCKPLLDALRNGGITPDDNPETITLTVEQQKVPSYARERTEIEIVYP